MNPKQAERLGNLLRTARHDKKLSAVQLGKLTDISDGTIIRFENAKILNPSPDKLTRIAEALDLNVADVLTLAEYPRSEGLPAMPLYLRAKYRDLPDDAIESIERSINRIANKHGVALDGPTAGEDEAP